MKDNDMTDIEIELKAMYREVTGAAAATDLTVAHEPNQSGSDRRRTATVVLSAAAAVVAVAIVSAIGVRAFNDGDEDGRLVADESPTASTATSPDLMVMPEIDPNVNLMTASPGGVLEVNEHGCVTVGGYPLVAPPGSTLTADLAGVEFPGAGQIRLGELVQGAGGVVPGDTVARRIDRRGCASSGPTREVVILYSIEIVKRD